MREYRTERGVFYHGDCMVGMAATPDKHYDIAIVDPPYGIGMDNSRRRTKPSRSNSYKNYPKNRYKKSDWDKNIMTKKYFNELYRISKNQIIWGANYFCEYIKNGYGWIFWNKLNGKNNFFSDGEFAFASKGVQSRCFECSQFDGLHGGKSRIHPTQKPLALYKWLVKNYVKSGWKILDTHVGSASSLIAYEEAGLEYVGYELDVDYYKSAVQRIKDYRAQGQLFVQQFTPAKAVSNA